ncbi:MULTISPECIES: hypothetical protein [Vibrio]|uniref:Uncharacterized protein n=2 Tax=Vibrio TaxID=662 RepID=A0A7X4LHC2_9VIBR|nr:MULTISPECIES: hypothetical protein [Vibrio]MBF9003183.1 hypothetical protein [Vibrio nitrifigilis]MZI91907.1 hypothetical protein [Vibrio eleionomae]
MIIKKLFSPCSIMLVIYCGFFSTIANANDWYSQNDDKQHTGASFVIGAASEVYFDNLIYSNATCMTVGLAKEVRDQIAYHGFSKSDLGYDAVGCITGTLLSRFVMRGLSLSASGNSFALNYTAKF